MRSKFVNESYKGVKISRVNNNLTARPNVKVVARYCIDFHGIAVYFTTQDEVVEFIDKVFKGKNMGQRLVVTVKSKNEEIA